MLRSACGTLMQSENERNFTESRTRVLMRTSHSMSGSTDDYCLVSGDSAELDGDGGVVVAGRGSLSFRAAPRQHGDLSGKVVAVASHRRVLVLSARAQEPLQMPPSPLPLDLSLHLRNKKSKETPVTSVNFHITDFFRLHTQNKITNQCKYYTILLLGQVKRSDLPCLIYSNVPHKGVQWKCVYLNMKSLSRLKRSSGEKQINQNCPKL